MKWLKSFLKALRESDVRENESLEPLGNFTPRAQQVLALSCMEARRLGHAFVGTEHLLLGIVSLGQGTAAAVLGKMGLLDLKFVRDKVEQQVGGGTAEKVPDRIPYTPRVKRVLALAAKEAKSLQHKYVGTEHILLGLLREGDGLAGRILKELGLSVEITRQQILRELDPNFSVTAGEDPIPQQEERKKPAREIDTSKRYDVYYRVGQQEVVYRNVLFKDIRTLFPRSEQDVFSQYMEIEQPDGRIVFVARSALTKFCEHGTEPGEAGA